MENRKAKESSENIPSSLGLEGGKTQLVYSSETSGVSMALSVFCGKKVFFYAFCKFLLHAIAVIFYRSGYTK